MREDFYGSLCRLVLEKHTSANLWKQVGFWLFEDDGRAGPRAGEDDQGSLGLARKLVSRAARGAMGAKFETAD